MNYLESYVQHTSTNASLILLLAWILKNGTKSVTIAGYAQSDEVFQLHNDIIEDMLKVCYKVYRNNRKIYIENHRGNETSILKFRTNDTIRDRGIMLLDEWKSYE